MIRRLFHRCTEAEHPFFVKAIGGQDLMDDEVALGNGPGLVKDDGADIFQLFDGNASLKQIPCFDAAPMPAKKLRGTLSTRAQGQLMTRKVKAV